MTDDLESLRAAHAAERLPRTMMDLPLQVTDILRRVEALFPDVEVVVRDGPGRLRRTTYGAIVDQARRLAGLLASLRLAPGSRVATLMWNHDLHLAAFHAAPAVDAVLHPLNPRLSPDELAYIVADAGDAAIVVDEDLLPLWTEVARRVAVPHVFVNGDGDAARASGHARIVDALAAVAPHDGRPVGPADEDAAISVCYTSGTTGRPKGVVCTHRSVLLHGLAIATPDAMAISGRDTLLLLTPMFHVNGWSIPYTAPMFGTRLVLPGPRITSTEVLDLMIDEAVTGAFGVPTFWNDVLQAIDREPGRWPLRPGTRLYVGGAPPPATLFRRFGALGVHVQTGWGMTECSPIGSQTWLQRRHDALAPEARIAVQTSNGLPLPFVEMRHVDDDGASLPRDGIARGELQVRGPWVTRAYVGWPETLDATTADGWLRTGDIVTIAADGYVRLVDRLKDLVKSGGEWISSVELEQLIAEHPDVLEAAVIAVPDLRWGERPLAVVVAKPGRVATAQAIRDHVATRVPAWMVPDRIETVDALPKTGVGKLDKVALRKRFGAT